MLRALTMALCLVVCSVSVIRWFAPDSEATAGKPRLLACSRSVAVLDTRQPVRLRSGSTLPDRSKIVAAVASDASPALYASGSADGVRFIARSQCHSAASSGRGPPRLV